MAKIHSSTSSGSAGPNNGSRKLFTLVLMALFYLVGYLHGSNRTSRVLSAINSSWLCSTALNTNTIVASTADQHQEGAPLENKDAKFASDGDGWKAINVFYGNENHLSTNWIKKQENKNRKWFSQSKQDEVIIALLRGKHDGYFIDLAANHAFRLSNSFALEQSYGWKGLCIEPNPEYWVGLAYRKCQVAAAVVGKNRMEEISFSFRNVFGGIAQEGFDNSKADKRKTEKRYTVPLQEILNRASAPRVIDYFSLDVEGAEWYILESFPFDQYKVKIMTIERPNAELKELLGKYNYQFVATISSFGETLWVHKDFASDLDMEAFHQLNAES